MKAKLSLRIIARGLGFALCSSIPIYADAPPQIIDPPLTQFAWVGRPVTLKVTFTNKTAMTYQWLWNGGDLPDATNKNYHLASAQLTNAGNYRVILNNAAGSTTSAVARLTVRDWPQPTGVSFVNLTNIEKSLQSVMKSHVVPAASLAVMKDGRLIAARGYGFSDPEKDEVTQPDSLFRIASLSKAITATAILKLVDEGRLSLDDKVFPLLNLPPPTFSGAKMDPRLTNITVRHCLNHTAGWDRDTGLNPNGGIGFNHNMWIQRCAKDLGLTRPVTAKDMVQWITGFPLQHTPGTVFDYVNMDYMTLGVLIEQLTGRGYEESVKELLSTAEITRLRFSGVDVSNPVRPEVVDWLSPQLDPRDPSVGGPPIESITSPFNMDTPPIVFAGAGAWATTPMDYARFITTIDGNPAPPDIISTNAEKAMLTVTPQSRTAGQPYGMGWDIDDATGDISHGGAMFVADTMAARKKDGTVYVLFLNTMDFTLYDAAQSVVESGISAIKSWPTNDLFPATISYEAWQARHFTAAELAKPDISGDDADPDGDGMSNLVEFAQGSDPRVADHEPWLKGRRMAEGDQVRFALEYRCRPLGHAVAYELEVSSDLKTWQPFDATTTEQLDPDGMLTVSVQDAAANANQGVLFYRVKVRRSHPKAGSL